MSVEMIAMIIAAASLLVTLGGGLFAGFAWMLRRIDEKFAKVDERFVQAEASVKAQFDKVDERFDRVDQKFDRIDECINGVQAELTEVKVAVARLEGPRPRLIMPH